MKEYGEAIYAQLDDDAKEQAFDDWLAIRDGVEPKASVKTLNKHTVSDVKQTLANVAKAVSTRSPCSHGVAPAFPG